MIKFFIILIITLILLFLIRVITERYDKTPSETQEDTNASKDNFCSNCGHKIKSFDKFCDNCGYYLGSYSRLKDEIDLRFKPYDKFSDKEPWEDIKRYIIRHSQQEFEWRALKLYNSRQIKKIEDYEDYYTLQTNAPSLIKYLSSHGPNHIKNKIYDLILSGDVVSNNQIDDVIKRYRDTKIVSAKRPSKPFFDHSNDYMTSEEIKAAINAHRRRPSRYTYYSSSDSEPDLSESCICPMCGSSDFVGGYCDDCGWIE